MQPIPSWTLGVAEANGPEGPQRQFFAFAGQRLERMLELTLHMNWKDYLIAEPDVLAGKAVLKGTCLSVDVILERLADGWTREHLLHSYPTLTQEGL